MATTIALSSDSTKLLAGLQERGLADVLDASDLARALYSSDASLYRVVPAAVARPRTVDELGEVLDVARSAGVPVTTRGAGISCAGNAVGSGLVVDTARHLNMIIRVDTETRTAEVEPGVVQASLQTAAARYGLRFGPDPSTHARCTIGGMIGNNACGPRALAFGKTGDNVLGLDLITGSGERLRLDGESSTVGSTSLSALEQVVRSGLGTIRTEFGRFGRQVSGYSLEHLLPENQFNVARFLAGSEGTLGVITAARVRLVEDAAHKIMVALGYPSMAEAADAAPVILTHMPTACEGLDRRIVDVVARTRGAAAVPPLPRGDGWVLVELVGDDHAQLQARAERLLAEAAALDGRVVSDPVESLALWKIREDGAGLAGVSLSRPAYPGWEDAAVPPASLGAYLRDFDKLLADHGLDGLPYGHFGDGCVHVRIDFPLTEPGGRAQYRRFVEEAARLVAGYGGSMSGEHGDGRARSALLGRMYSAAALDLFASVKAAFDPNNLLNPGVLVDPRPADADIRAVALIGRSSPFAAAVHEALDLCLSCKGCARDCPTGIDMAAYKSEVLDRTYRGRLRPRSHYALGWLPRWGRLITRFPALSALINLTTRTPGLRRLVRWSAGVDQRRSLPRFARRSARSRVRLPSSNGRPVVVWIDSFSDCFTGDAVAAAVAVLSAAGYAPQFLDRPACCR